MYCLDSNVLINLLRGKKEIVDRSNKLRLLSINASISHINLFELYKGAYLTTNPELSVKLIEDLIKNIEVLEFTNECYGIFGRNYAYLRKKGKIIEDFDLMIASVCLAHNKTLITMDKKHFLDIPTLKIEEW